jgi:hypothetical protein
MKAKLGNTVYFAAGTHCLPPSVLFPLTVVATFMNMERHGNFALQVEGSQVKQLV